MFRISTRRETDDATTPGRPPELPVYVASGQHISFFSWFQIAAQNSAKSREKLQK